MPIFRSAITFVLIITAVSFIGCCQPDIHDSGSTNQLSVWVDSASGQVEFFTRAAREFERQNDGVSVRTRFIRFQELKPTFAGRASDSSEPDLVLIAGDWVGELASAGLIASITFDDSDYIAAARHSFEYKGSTYAMPWSFEAIALVYNRSLVSQPPQSFSDIIELAQSLNDASIVPLIYDNRNFYYHAPFYHAFSAAIDPGLPDFGLDSSQAHDSIKFAIDLEKTHNIVPASSNAAAAVNLFVAGRAACIITGPWSLPQLSRSDIDFAVSFIPEINGEAPSRPFLGSRALAINSASVNHKLAHSFIEFINSPQMLKMAMTEAGILAARKSLYDTQQVDEAAIGFYQQALNAIPLPNAPQMKYLWEESNWVLTQSFLGSEEPRKLLASAAARLRRRRQNDLW